jgi:hypothetical protein
MCSDSSQDKPFNFAQVRFRGNGTGKQTRNMTERPNLDAKYWRTRAEAARIAASPLADGQVRLMFEDMANLYDDLATQAGQRFDIARLERLRADRRKNKRSRLAPDRPPETLCAANPGSQAAAR